MNQLNLELFRARPAIDPDVTWMEETLKQNPRWMLAPELKAESGGRLCLRTLRLLAESATPKVISGQDGYKHTDHATGEEVRRFINRMESQSKKMTQRANSVRKYAHTKVG